LKTIAHPLYIFTNRVVEGERKLEHIIPSHTSPQNNISWLQPCRQVISDSRIRTSSDNNLICTTHHLSPLLLPLLSCLVLYRPISCHLLERVNRGWFGVESAPWKPVSVTYLRSFAFARENRTQRDQINESCGVFCFFLSR
jgi:hypothetical protein